MSCVLTPLCPPHIPLDLSVRCFFSYEHFYVLYCRFFELDADKDTKLSKEDLLKYGDHTLSEAIVDRVFQVGGRVFSDGRVGGFTRSGLTYPGMCACVCICSITCVSFSVRA